MRIMNINNLLSKKLFHILGIALIPVYIFSVFFLDVIIDMKQSLFAPWGSAIIVAAEGALMTISLSAVDISDYLERVAIWLGKNSLIIMLVHFIFIEILGYGLQHVFHLTPFYYGVAINVIIWPIIYFSVIVINGYCPWIVSKKKNKAI